MSKHWMIPHEAWAALISGLGMLGGYALHHQRIEAASLLFLFSLSGALEAFAMGRTKEAIQKLVGMRPKTIRFADERIGSVEEAVVGDAFLVFPGEAIPLDGVIVEGLTSVDQAAMTGESEPVTRGPKEKVLAGTLNLEGRLLVRASAAQKDSALERVISLVAAAQEEKSLGSAERLADRVGRWYAPLVLVTALCWFLWRRLTLPLGEAAYSPLTLLVAGSPCALVLSSPAAVLSALAGAGRRGLLIRSGAVLEHLAQIQLVAFDKTGTLTTGKPSVQSAWSSDANTDRLFAYTAAVEAPLPHPLARAIVLAAEARGLALPGATAFQALAGKGVSAMIEGQLYQVGRPEWLASPVLETRIEAARAEGASVVAVTWPKGCGLFALTDTIRPDAPGALAELKALGIETVLLTGDHRRSGEALARQLPIGIVHADLHPEDKERLIGEFSSTGKLVAMVGDGINDAPALARAAVGITLGGIGSDVALESADVVVMEDRLDGVPEAIQLGKKTRQVVLQNVIVSLLGVTLLSLAVLIQGVPLPLAVVFHEGTTVLVVLNGLRLLRA